MEVNSSNYDDILAKRFCDDMAEAGFEVEHYNGRYFWEGPAVRCDNIQDVLLNTKVKCQWDNMGRGWIVYPKQSAKMKG